jgi:predicted kinase
MVVLIGPPGVGKSTWAYEQPGEHITLSPDDYRKGAWTYAKHLDAMRQLIAEADAIAREGRGVILDSTGSSRNLRNTFRDTAVRHGARLYGVVFTAPMHVAQQRNATRPNAVDPELVARIHSQITIDLPSIAAEPWDGLYSHE